MKLLKKILKVLGIILLILLIAAVFVWFFVLQYPNLKTDPKEGKWYRISSEMKDSEGGSYHALFRKGSENKV